MDDLYESLIMKIGIFLGMIPILGILLGYIHLIYWWILIPLIILPLTLIIIREDKKITTPTKQFILVCFIVLASLLMFSRGAFQQQWLEDGDPYGYAVVTEYISETHSQVKNPNLYLSNYAEPDPVGYSILMSIIHQITNRMEWTLKVVNIFIISFGLFFCFYFFKHFIGNETKALITTFFLAAIPSFLTRFIFATPYAVILWFPAFYCIEKIKERPIWTVPSIFIIASILVTHHLVGFVFGLFFLVYFIFNRSIFVLISGVGGFLLSLVSFWIPIFIKYSWEGMKEHMGITSATSIAGTADKVYHLTDFIFTSGQNMINTSIGWGVIISLLLIIGLLVIIKSKNELFKKDYIRISFIWLCISLIGVNATLLPIKLMPFRWWTFLAIPVCILASEGAYSLMSIKKSRILIIFIILVGVILSSGVPKYNINAAYPWFPQQSVAEMLPGLLALKELPTNTPVFSFSGNHIVISFDKYTCVWCNDEEEFRKDFLMHSPEDIKRFMIQHNYKYLFFHIRYFTEFGIEETTKKLNELEDSKLFFPYKTGEGYLILTI